MEDDIRQAQLEDLAETVQQMTADAQRAQFIESLLRAFVDVFDQHVRVAKQHLGVDYSGPKTPYLPVKAEVVMKLCRQFAEDLPQMIELTESLSPREVTHVRYHAKLYLITPDGFTALCSIFDRMREVGLLPPLPKVAT